MSVLVKICGLTRLEDGIAAAEAGAEAIGLMLYEKSPRYIGMQKAAELSRALPQFLIRVGVFANASEDFVQRAISECGLNIAQFHGDESPEFCLRFPVMTIKAFPMKDAGSLNALADYHTNAFLLDAYDPDKLGGTGARFNWDLAIQAHNFGKPIFLAGGLTPENVAEAVDKVRPYAVDVSSGVESAPGIKDHDKIRALIKAAKSIVY